MLNFKCALNKSTVNCFNMADFDTLKQQAEALGYKDENIARYVSEQQAILREERAKERELQKLQIEADNQKTRMDHDLAMAKLKSTQNAIDPVSATGIVRPTLPVFKDDEDISNYLIRFERVADLLNIDKSTYAVRLGSLLTGKAVEVYTSLSPQITADYDMSAQRL